MCENTSEPRPADSFPSFENDVDIRLHSNRLEAKKKQSLERVISLSLSLLFTKRLAQTDTKMAHNEEPESWFIKVAL